MKKSRLVQNVADRFGLIVSIPANCPELAYSAQKGGADGIKVHLNVGHYASGTVFGSWQQERENIRRILDRVNIPVGILPGADVIASAGEIREARDMGIDFIDAFAHHMPMDLWSVDGLGRMIAVNDDYSSRQVSYIGELGGDLVEATLLTHDQYRRDLTLGDLTLYRQLVESTDLPVYVPTQKKIRPGEIHHLARAGVRGIVIGAVVTGDDADNLRQVTEAFSREARSA